MTTILLVVGALVVAVVVAMIRIEAAKPVRQLTPAEEAMYDLLPTVPSDAVTVRIEKTMGGVA